MARTNNAMKGIKPEPLVVSRVFPAPRDLVFKAWSSAEHLKRWFSPEGMSVPEAAIDFSPGGIFDICMRSPEGQDFWSRGSYDEISPPARLAFTSSVTIAGSKKFTVQTTVTFENQGAGTLLTVHQLYDIHDESFLGAVEGSAAGWRTTLDKLEREVARIHAQHSAHTQASQPRSAVRSAVHATFSIERLYDASPAKVFHALSDKAAKASWFVGGEGYTVLEREMEVRPGGRERVKGRWANGTVSTFDAVYFDAVPDERLVYAYEMHLDDRKISVSLATLELKPERAGTRLVITEQGTFLDGYDDAGSREKGTGLLLDKLGTALQR
jgi:uncharacterized protein YndB with AHSA1/START domain